MGPIFSKIAMKHTFCCEFGSFSWVKGGRRSSRATHMMAETPAPWDYGVDVSDEIICSTDFEFFMPSMHTSRTLIILII